MTKEDYEEAKIETEKMWEAGLFTYPEYEAVIKILFEKRYGILVPTRRRYKRMP